MDHKLHLDLVYENNLDTDKFARMIIKHKAINFTGLKQY